MKKLPEYLFDANVDDDGNIKVESFRVWEFRVAEGASVPTYVASRKGMQFQCSKEMYATTRAAALRRLRKECAENIVNLRSDMRVAADELKMYSKARLKILEMLKPVEETR